MEIFKTGKTYCSLPHWRSNGIEKIRIIGRTETGNGMRRLKIRRDREAEYVYALGQYPKGTVVRADGEEAT